MATVAATTQQVNKAFYGFLDTEHGVFTMLDGVVVFMASATEELRIVERGIRWQALGEVGIADAALVLDKLHGGPVGICLSRAQEVA